MGQQLHDNPLGTDGFEFVEFRLTGPGHGLGVLGFGNDAGLELVAAQPLAFPLQSQSLVHLRRQIGRLVSGGL